jgi:hypothetical protein
MGSYGRIKPSRTSAKRSRGVALSAVARVFAELSEVARELAAEIERVDSRPAARRRAG